MKSWKASKEQPEILCWKVQDRAQSFAFRSYTMHDHVTKTFLLFGSLVKGKQLVSSFVLLHKFFMKKFRFRGIAIN